MEGQGVGQPENNPDPQQKQLCVRLQAQLPPRRPREGGDQIPDQ